MKDQEQQFLESYDAYSDALFRFAYFQVSDREVAKDIVQDAFMETWKCIADGGDIHNIRAYLYRVVRNRITDHYRKHKAQSLEAFQESGGDMGDEKSARFSEMNAEASHMLRLFQGVEEKYRGPVLLRYMEGMAVKDIAKTLGETESNTSVLIHRGLEKLKQLAHI